MISIVLMISGISLLAQAPPAPPSSANQGGTGPVGGGGAPISGGNSKKAARDILNGVINGRKTLQGMNAGNSRTSFFCRFKKVKAACATHMKNIFPFN